MKKYNKGFLCFAVFIDNIINALYQYVIYINDNNILSFINMLANKKILCN